ncbi:gamma-glutamyl cyclotransferase [Opitutaceae bacterium TAV5]|nr:gamma-glutamyl cyclotransferase [Opitutaceae bacterium TAV5]
MTLPRHRHVHRLFVYGTLMRGESNHRLMAGHRFVTRARTLARYRLYNLGDYPGMVEDPVNPLSVEGEIWEVDAAGLAALDAFEGVAEALYARVPVPLAPPHADLAVDGYLYLRPVTGAADIGGRWR